MNIQQYYEKTASISLNASMASLVPPFFLIVYGIIIAPQGKMVFIVLPFLLYSFICYQFYLINDKRAKEITENHIDDKTSILLKKDSVLITFMPAPSLRMLLFDPEGQLVGEIKDMKFWSIRWVMPYFLDKLFKRKYGLYDETNGLIAIFIVKNNRIEILDSEGILKSSIIQKPSQKRSEFIFQKKGKRITVERSLLFMDYRFFKGDRIKAGRLRKGLMPLEWGKRFKDANTPVMSFEQDLEGEDRVEIFAILTKLFHYTNH
ncbi:hypothetical protein BGM26_07220 [Bacillus sp. FJAT-29790]|uniref:hypothetical protein n=1 Tax=Bacillus sp. FJAT-29790 TaxID=1895002 RepID=UPI001C246B94|nr:hypothetical protein [Bacillus sp. FJAT-29790]MBU8878779.1 hypothetical protein [Bacillus sp. FJAT-29790]